MTLIAIIFTAFGLAMDAFAVSVVSGFTIKRLHLRHAIIIALSFGLFQAVMPVLGWLAGTGVRELIQHIEHWLAFGLLSFIGIKMIYESTKLESIENRKDPLAFPVLIVLSIATSIDALAVGLTFAFLKVAIVGPVIIIGLITFALSILGVYIGDKFGHFFEKKIEALGGIILILIGLKILTFHLLGHAY